MFLFARQYEYIVSPLQRYCCQFCLVCQSLILLNLTLNVRAKVPITRRYNMLFAAHSYNCILTGK